MIRLRTASALAAGTVAALALGGTALAAGRDDPSSPPAVEMRPDGTVVETQSPSPGPSSSTDDSAGPTPSESSSSGPASPAPTSSAPSKPPASSAASAGAISLADAKAIAIRAAGGGRVTDAERETEHGRAVWDIEVRVGPVEHDIDVDRATGEVLRHKRDDDRWDD